MGSVCNCPRGAAMPDVPQSDCPVTFGQIQKVAFQRLYKEDGTPNKFDSAEDIKLLASWATLLTAADSTKVVVSPYIEAPADEPGAARTFGGGNETPGGIAYAIGREPTAFTGQIRRVDQIKVITPLREIVECENVGVFIFDDNGQIEALNYGTDAAPDYRPIPIQGGFVGDMAHGNYEGVDSNAISWSYPPKWSEKRVIIKPTDFNPVTDLRVAP